jgi:hypothetical protein
MKYYTIRMFSEGLILETLTTKVAVNRMPDKTVKLLMESHDADEAQVYESTSWGHYETGRSNTQPIRTIKL